MKQLLKEHDWEFQNQDGGGYFFEKENEKLIVTTQMWAGEYVIVQVAEEWEE